MYLRKESSLTWLSIKKLSLVRLSLTHIYDKGRFEKRVFFNLGYRCKTELGGPPPQFGFATKAELGEESSLT